MALKGARGTVSIIDKATAPLKSIAGAFKGLGTASTTANKDLSKTQKAINGISTAQNRLKRASAGIDRQTKGIGSQAVGVAALALSFKAALSPAIKFEQAMKDLESVAFGAADATVPVRQNMDLLSKQAKQLGSTTAFSATQAAEGQLFLAKAGFKTNQILSAMPSLLDLAAASGTDLGRSSDILSDLLGAFGKTAEDTGQLADLLAAATSSANVDMESLFETLKVVAPIGVTAGQSMEEMVAATALLGNVGIKGSMGATALKNAMTRLAAPASAGKKVLKELGINVADASGNMRSINKIVGELALKAGKLSQVKRIEAFEAIFGKQALAGGVGLAKFAKSGVFEKTIKQFSDVHGVSKKMAKIRMDSTEGSIVQLMSAVEGLAISFGSVLTPILRGTAEVMTSLTAQIQAFVQENEGLVKGIGIAAGALLSAKIVALGYTATLWLVSPALKALTFALALTKAPLITFNALLVANPIGVAVVAVAALTAGIILLTKNWDKVTAAIKDSLNILDNFKKTADAIGLTDLFGGETEAEKILKDTEKFKPQWVKDFEAEQANAQATGAIATPAMATQQIQANSINNNQANITVNIEDGKAKSVKTDGDFKTDVFLNNGVQE